MHRNHLRVIGLGAFWVMMISAGLMSCREQGRTHRGSSDGDGGSGGTAGGATTSTGNGGGTTTSSGVGGSGGSLPVVTIENITNGSIGPGIDVEVKGVVAMSHKWLVSKSKTTGSCLWGVFLSSPGLTETQPYSGILGVSYGTPGTLQPDGSLRCPNLEVEPVGDAFPDDVKPGDVLDVRGETSYFLLSQCASEPPQNNPSQVMQRQLAKIDLVTRTGTGPVPTPHTVTDIERDKLSSPSDQTFHDQWGGVKVRITGQISPVLQGPVGMETVVGAFGNITLPFPATPVEANVKVGDKLYYVGGSMNPCHQGPDFPDTSIVWTQIDAFSGIDYCTWGLQAANKCTDFQPAGDDCQAGLMCP